MAYPPKRPTAAARTDDIQWRRARRVVRLQYPCLCCPVARSLNRRRRSSSRLRGRNSLWRRVPVHLWTRVVQPACARGAHPTWTSVVEYDRAIRCTDAPHHGRSARSARGLVYRTGVVRTCVASAHRYGPHFDTKIAREAHMHTVILETSLVSPACGHQAQETVPAAASQYFYECGGCAVHCCVPELITVACTALTDRCPVLLVRQAGNCSRWDEHASDRAISLKR